MKNIIIKIVLIISLIPIVCFGFMGCQSENNSDSNLFLLGLTTFSKLQGGNVKSAEKEMEKFLIDIDNQVSLNNPESDVSKINNAIENEEVEVSNNTYELIIQAKEYYTLTDGAFNIAIYPLIEKWGFSPKNEGHYNDSREEPSADELRNCIIDLNFLNAKQQDGKNIITKTNANLKIDLGGIAKGYAADKCIEILNKNGVTSGVINIGGNLYAHGEKPGVGNFKIGISNPRGSGQLCQVDCSSTSVVTSGDYERYYLYDNERYHHIIDGETKKPAGIGVSENERVISCIIIDQSSALADAFATTVMVKGKTEGISFLINNSKKGIVVTADKRIYVVGDIDIKAINTDFILNN